MTFDSLQPVFLMLLYLSDGILNEASTVPAFTSSSPSSIATRMMDAASQSAIPTPTSAHQPSLPVNTTSSSSSLMSPSPATSTTSASAVNGQSAMSSKSALMSPTSTGAPQFNALTDAQLLPPPASTNGTALLVAMVASVAASANKDTAKMPAGQAATPVAPRTALSGPIVTEHKTAGPAQQQRQQQQQQHNKQQHNKQQQQQQHQSARQQRLPHQQQPSMQLQQKVQPQPSRTADKTADKFANNAAYGITNVTAQIGTNAYLPCKVNKTINKSVSWVRIRDDHILTVDRLIFIADERFNAINPAGGDAPEQPDSWQLQIKYVQARDEGLYECQVSSEPKVSATIRLKVVVPRTEMIGDTSRYVKEGSKVSLHCVVTGAIDPPLYIIWYHGEHQVFPDDRRGWRTDINRESVQANPAHGTIGTLIIPAVRKRDSGNYTCSPSNSLAISTILTVINGEYSASAITSAASAGANADRSTRSRNCQLIAVILCAVLLMVLQSTTSTDTGSSSSSISTYRSSSLQQFT